MPRFRLKADGEFEANDIDDALTLLSDHLAAVRDGDDEGQKRLGFVGCIRVERTSSGRDVDRDEAKLAWRRMWREEDP